MEVEEVGGGVHRGARAARLGDHLEAVAGDRTLGVGPSLCVVAVLTPESPSTAARPMSVAARGRLAGRARRWSARAASHDRVHPEVMALHARHRGESVATLPQGAH